jgi:hypothetical protein
MTWMGWLVVLVAAGCSSTRQVEGDGDIIEEPRTVEPFTGVAVSDLLRVEVSPGPHSVVLAMDKNLVPLLRTRVAAGILHVEPAVPDTNLVPSGRAVVRVTSPTVTYVEASGDARIVATNASAERVVIVVDGTSAAGVSGSAAHVTMHVSGDSAADSDVAAREVELDVSGVSRVRVRAAERVTGEVSGDSQVVVAGSPRERLVETSGVSTVAYPE